MPAVPGVTSLAHPCEYITPPPLIPLSGTYLVLTLCCPAPLPPADPGFLAAHKLQLICRPYGRSTQHDFPYKQLTESEYSVVPVSFG